MSQFFKKRLENLESHLKAENPALLEVLPTYYKLDKILYWVEPVGWGTRASKKMRTVREIAANHIQSLNDRFADPSGKSNSKIIETVVEEDTVDKTAEKPTE
ncbi:MAG: hypothetical protein ABGW81_05045 [Paracoccaceae bacterium]